MPKKQEGIRGLNGPGPHAYLFTAHIMFTGYINCDGTSWNTCIKEGLCFTIFIPRIAQLRQKLYITCEAVIAISLKHFCFVSKEIVCQAYFLVQYYRLIFALKPHFRESFDITPEAVSHLLAAKWFTVETIYEESYLQGNQN